MNLRPYISLARIDNWTKNLLVLVGVGLAMTLSDFVIKPGIGTLLLVLASVCFASSANYVLNEFMDAQSDGYHPVKKSRAAVKQSLKPMIVAAEYALFGFLALILAYHANPYIVGIIAFYMACAWAYNIPPLRGKDIAYVDVILESINYPIRILLGWMCVLSPYFPPSSIIIISWAIGAFTMNLKRLAEYPLFTSAEQAAKYRKSYSQYNLSALIAAGFVYGTIVIFGMSIFLLKYKVELILLIPLLIIWLSWYFIMALRQDISVIYPEKLLRKKVFVVFSCLIFALAIILLKVNIAWLHILEEPLHFIVPAND